MGAVWPVPRFTDNLDGAVTDNLTGLMWLTDANCIETNYPGFDNDGMVIWQHALDFVAGVNDGSYSLCGAGYTDWRLPNLRELHSLIDCGQFNLALPSGHPFTNSPSIGSYWSSNTNPYDGFTDYAKDVNFNTGAAGINHKEGHRYVRAVRGGQ